MVLKQVQAPLEADFLLQGTVEILNRALQAKKASNWCFGCEAA